jgi:uncharacterized protein YbbK (DUF523 family)
LTITQAKRCWKKRQKAGKKMKICSACLMGINCRYDGGNNRNEKLIKLAKAEIIIPICPEQLGGLATPRPPAEKVENSILTKSGEEVTAAFQKGAEEVLKICQFYKISEAILKQRSPSCGCGQIYDGTFSGNMIEGDGITTSLLKKHGLRIISEEDL